MFQKNDMRNKGPDVADNTSVCLFLNEDCFLCANKQL